MEFGFKRSYPSHLTVSRTFNISTVSSRTVVSTDPLTLFEMQCDFVRPFYGSQF